jgi:Muskelin N-terminus
MSVNNGSSHPQPILLSYTIAGCSEHSNRYVAENIMVDAPADVHSRWSGLHEDPSIKQWILLRLDTLSVIGEFLDLRSTGSLLKFAQDSITFGKVRAPRYLYARLPISSTPLP